MFMATAEARGRRRAVTAQWIASARAALARSKRSKASLGAKCGTSGPYISQLLSGKYETSTYLDCLSRELEIDAPPIEVATPELRDIMDMAAGLDEDMIKQLRVVAKSLLELQTKKNS